MRPITEIILHTSATAGDWMAGHTTKAKLDEIRRWHTAKPPKGNGWRDIGYHYLIDLDGTVKSGRPLEEIGAHVKGRNKGTIGICLVSKRVGKATDAFLDNYTEQQEVALIELIRGLHQRFGKVPVTGHNQYAAKECPCFDAPKWWAKASAPKVSATTAATGAGAAILGGVSHSLGLPPVAVMIAAIAGAVALWLIIRRMKR